MTLLESTYGSQPYGNRPNDVLLPGKTALRYFAAAFFTLTVLTDWAYVQTMILMWKDFSSWLLFAGLVAGGLCVVLWLVSLAFYRRRPLWSVVALNTLILAAAFVNSLLHAGDGWTYVVPWGIGLSFVTFLLMLASAVLERRTMVGRIGYARFGDSK